MKNYELYLVVPATPVKEEHSREIRIVITPEKRIIMANPIDEELAQGIREYLETHFAKEICYEQPRS